ncbi:caspase family protein [Sphingopyxis sp.]|uniref:caspase family protein n=1 Tax=Sphingopyxis sp. TaxID=1908224 RepID=UPI0035B1D774
MAVRRIGLILAAHLSAAAGTVAAAEAAPTVVITSVAPGEEAIDRDAFGGNPLASALVAVAGDRRTAFRDALPRLLDLTTAYGNEHHHPVAGALADDSWRLGTAAPGERRVALVAVFAEYRLDSQLPSLPGAAFDAVRISRALRSAGFATEMVVALDAAELRAALARHSRQAADADTSLIYVTGHGVEHDGRIALLPGDYPARSGAAALPTRAIMLDEIAGAGRALRRNLLFYGGCRNDPFAAKAGSAPAGKH